MAGRAAYPPELVERYLALRRTGKTRIEAAESCVIPPCTGDSWWGRARKEELAKAGQAYHRGQHPPEKREAYLADIALGMRVVDADAKHGINRKTGARWRTVGRARIAVTSSLDGLAPPKSKQQISASREATRAFKDFAYFRRICFGAITTPAQAALAERLREAVETNRREFVLTTAFPGFGKTLFYKHFVIWMIVRNRSIRIIWGSGSDVLAVAAVNDIRHELSRTEPAEGNAEDIRSGRGVAPKFTVAQLFGRFRPSALHGVKWRQGELSVSTVKPLGGEGAPASGPTLLAVGPGTKQLGKRANLIVWDDIWTAEYNDNITLGNKIKKFFDFTARTRLQESGTMCLVMQRLGPADLARYVMDRRRRVRDPDTGAEVGWEPTWRHINFPAHHDDLCTGLHPNGMKAWDPLDPQVGRCLTDPLAIPPDDYLLLKDNPEWLVAYQQNDIDAAGAVFREIWLTGGTDEDKATYPGCLDYDRGLWELPDGVPKDKLAVAVAIDVGVEGYWGLYLSAVHIDPQSHMEWILAAEHRRMPAGTERGLLDYDFEKERFVGILDEWWERCRDLGTPMTHVVAEINCAQRHLFRDTNVVNRWQLARNCRILAHTTTKNKTDPKLGVEHLLAMRMQLGAVRFPSRGTAQTAMRDLYNEIVGYKQGWPTTDLVMPMWFRALNRRRTLPLPDQEQRKAAGGPKPVPAWMADLADRRFAR